MAVNRESDGQPVNRSHGGLDEGTLGRILNPESGHNITKKKTTLSNATKKEKQAQQAN